jgi:hypothetical protein
VLRLLCVILASHWLAVVAASQVIAPPPLSQSLRNIVEDGRFQIVTSTRGLPLDVRNELRKLFGGDTLDIAEPGAAFQPTGKIVDPNVPNRRLIAAGCTIEYCLVYYERGGAGRTWHVALFHWAPDATRFEWGGMAPGGLVTIEDVRKAILSGVIKSPARFW